MIASLTRLTIGGLLTGYDGLTKRLLVWEKELDLKAASQVEPEASDREASVAKEDETDHLRYAAIGAIFETEEALGKSLKTVDRLSWLAGDLLEGIITPVYSSRLFLPVRTRVDRLAQRGQNLVEDWVERGRAEEARSRALASTALAEQVDSSIEYLTANEEVQELVKSQSVGLVGEIVEETRERTVSADNYLEAWARTILRKPLRSDPPAPAPEVRARAIPLRRVEGKVIKK
jgi:hypothetical protein